MIPKKLKSATIKAMLKDAESRYPRESCGVVVITPSGKEQYIAIDNVSTDPTEEFVMCPEGFAAADEQGTIVGICHSHPDETTRPSIADIAVMSRNRELELIVDPDSVAIPWHIVSWPEGDHRQIIPEPEPSLLNRPFVHNVWDCWATCEAYYSKYHGLKFPKVSRKDRWWEEQETFSFYEEYYADWGFELVTTIQPGDMIVMQIGRSFHPNHAAIYLGEVEEFEGEKFHGKNLMLHHMYGKNSELAIYGGQWSQRTRMVLRHKEVNK
jgi:proteasome lid subunit RPN8/RPN11